MPLRIELDDPPPIRIAPQRAKSRRGRLIAIAVSLILGLCVVAGYALLRLTESRPSTPPEMLDYTNVAHAVGIKLPEGWKIIHVSDLREAEVTCGNGARKVLIQVSDIAASDRDLSEAEYLEKVAREEGLGVSAGEIQLGNTAANKYTNQAPPTDLIPQGVGICAVVRYRGTRYLVRGSAAEDEAVEFSQEFDTMAKGVFVLPRTGGQRG